MYDVGIDLHEKWTCFQVMGINGGEKSRLGQCGDKLSLYQVDKNPYRYTFQIHVNKLSTEIVENEQDHQ